MKKLQVALLGTTLAVALAVSGGSAYAAGSAKVGMVKADAPAALSGVYVSVFGGFALATDANGTYDSYGFTVPLSAGFLIGGAVGTHVMDNVRTELELSYVRHGVGSPITMWADTYTGSSGSVSTLYALGNIWLDINTNAGITPYIGGGVGFAVVMPDVQVPYSSYTLGWNGTAIAPAAQFGAGVKIPVADNMTVDLGYRAKAVFSHVWQADPNASYGNYAANKMNWLDQTFQVGLTVALP